MAIGGNEAYWEEREAKQNAQGSLRIPKGAPAEHVESIDEWWRRTTTPEQREKMAAEHHAEETVSFARYLAGTAIPYAFSRKKAGVLKKSFADAFKGACGGSRRRDESYCGPQASVKPERGKRIDPQSAGERQCLG